MIKRLMLRLAIIAACGPVLMVGAFVALMPSWRKRMIFSWGACSPCSKLLHYAA